MERVLFLERRWQDCFEGCSTIHTLHTASLATPTHQQHFHVEVWGGGGVGGGDPRVIISLYTAPKIICISFPHNNRAYMTAGADAPYTSGCYRHIYLAQKPDIYRCLGCNRVTNSVFMLRFRFFTGQCTIMDIFCVDSRVCTYAHLQYMIHLRPYHVHCSFQLKYMHSTSAIIHHHHHMSQSSPLFRGVGVRQVHWGYLRTISENVWNLPHVLKFEDIKFCGVLYMGMVTIG